MNIYVASSWRNAIQPSIVQSLRDAGHDVYDFRNPIAGDYGFSWSEVDPSWKQWTPEQFIQALYSGRPSIVRGFGLDKAALDICDVCVLVLPCGRSAHLEAGYAAGKGKKVIFYLHPDRFEPELMYLLGNGCVTSIEALLAALSSGGDPVSDTELLDALEKEVELYGPLTLWCWPEVPKGCVRGLSWREGLRTFREALKSLCQEFDNDENKAK